jgi:DNA-binding transcriptional ArsR family regulator
VCELTAALDVSQPKMSRHLGAMRALDVVEDCHIANRVFYRLSPGLPVWARGVINHLSDSVIASHEFKQIGKRLKDMPNRPQQRADFNDTEVDRKVSDAVSSERE